MVRQQIELLNGNTHKYNAHARCDTVGTWLTGRAAKFVLVMPKYSLLEWVKEENQMATSQ